LVSATNLISTDFFIVSKIKVLHIIKSLGRGGAEMLLQETLHLHDKERFDFHYIYFLPWKNQMVEGIEKAGGRVSLFPAVNNIRILLKARAVIHYIKKEKIELIHCHLPWAGFLGRWIHLRTGIPVIYTEHNIQDRYHLITRTLNKISFNYQTHVVAVSNDVAASIQRSISPKITVQTILNGVNTDRFIRDKVSGAELRNQYGISLHQILIGTIAVFRFQKRLKEWITVFKKIHQQFPDVRGVIIGDGPLKEEIHQHLRNEGMEDYILMPGLQTNVMPWLSAIDIFMMSSSFEGLPIALLEAMSMECAVVCTQAGGIKELIRHEQDGYTLPVEAWERLTEPMKRLLQDIQHKDEMGRCARARVVEAFSMHRMVKQTEEMYLNLLNRHHADS
jgi:glycosyltransferase involved in cell wall biosynthesis